MYGYTKQSDLNYEKTIEKVKQLLAQEGFGVLTEIDVKSTLKKKLGVEFDKYVILGACNPQNAYKALRAEREIGLMLPCNVIVYERKDEVFASAILPTVAMSMIKNPELAKVAEEVEEKLKKVIDRMEG